LYFVGDLVVAGNVTGLNLLGKPGVEIRAKVWINY
jgi:hypothetical protein